MLLDAVDVSKLLILHTCLDSIRGWMADNFLQLNEEKTEVLVCAPKKLVPYIRTFPADP